MATAPAQVTGVTATPSPPSTINLNWAAPASGGSPITSYRVERAPDAGGAPGTWTWSLETGSSIPGLSDTTVPPGTWWYRVYATNAIDRGLPSDPVSAVLPGLPAQITDLTAVATAPGTVSLNWSAPESGRPITGYRIERAPDASGTPGTWTTLIADTGTPIPGLSDTTAGTGTWWYRVSAINDLGTGTASIPATAAPLPSGLPGQVTGVTAVNSGPNTASVNWTAPSAGGSPIISYRVQRAPDVAGVPGVWSVQIDTGSPLPGLEDTSVTPGTWWYRVAATSALGDGPWSAPVWVLITGEPGQVFGLTGEQAGADTAALSWDVPTPGGGPIIGYRIQRALDDNGAPGTWTAQFEIVTEVPAYADRTAYGPAVYWYRVAAINAIGVGLFSMPVMVEIRGPAELGCPFGPSFPGWRIAVEVFYTPEPGRNYGDLNYGDEVYGDVSGLGRVWVDVTRPSFAVRIIAGNADGAPTVNVSQMQLDLRDDTGDWWDYAEPERYNLPYIGDPIRVKLISPDTVHHQIFGGRIAAIDDDHERPPRQVKVTAFGPIGDVVTPVLGWQRPVETLPQRIEALTQAAGGVAYVLDGVWTAPLLADAGPRDVDIRAETDRSAISSLAMMGETRDGRLWFRTWPLPGVGAPIWFTDCIEDDQPAGTILAGKMALAADWYTGVLNVGGVSNTAGHTVTATEPFSIAKYGRRGSMLGFPKTGLAYTDPSTGEQIAWNAVNRWANIVNRVDSVTIDTATAESRPWLAVLADLDVGRSFHLDRRGVRRYQLDGVIVGYAHTLTNNRAESTVNTATTTPTH